MIFWFCDYWLQFGKYKKTQPEYGLVVEFDWSVVGHRRLVARGEWGSFVFNGELVWFFFFNENIYFFSDWWGDIILAFYFKRKMGIKRILSVEYPKNFRES